MCKDLMVGAPFYGGRAFPSTFKIVRRLTELEHMYDENGEVVDGHSVNYMTITWVFRTKTVETLS